MLSFKGGKSIARIKDGKHSAILKFEEKKKKNNNLDLAKQDERLSFIERLAKDYSKEELIELLSENDKLRQRIHREINNDINIFTDYINEKDITVEDGLFQMIPDPKDFREVVYIYGASGSGKSSIARNYIKEYIREFPENTIYIISRKEKDPAFDDLSEYGKILRIPINEDILSEIEMETLANSLVVFDDYDSNDRTPENKLLTKLRDDICELGRSFRIFCLITTHSACSGPKTKVVLSESNKIVVFPNYVTPLHMKYLMENYGGLDKNQLKDLKKYNSRWIVVSRVHPRYVMHENGLILLD